MPSIEILVPKKDIIKEDLKYPFSIIFESPPCSHRDPSLWQTGFSLKGGTLYHLGNPNMKNKNEEWFYAYDIINIIDGKKFRFKPEYFNKVIEFIMYLFKQSNSDTLYFTTDWQFGPKPYYQKRVVKLGKFIENHNNMGIDLNRWIPIKM